MEIVFLTKHTKTNLFKFFMSRFNDEHVKQIGHVRALVLHHHIYKISFIVFDYEKVKKQSVIISDKLCEYMSL